MDPKTIRSAPALNHRLPFQEKIPGFLAALFFAALFFLCSADQFFAVRLHGYNLRFGQVLLLAACVLSLGKLLPEARKGTTRWLEFSSTAKNWIPFFLAYGVAALASSFPAHSLLKLGWALFNIGGAILLFSDSRWLPSLRKGFSWGILAIAALIWLQLIAIYLFGATNFDSGYPAASRPLFLSSLPHLTLGFVQNTHDAVDGVPILRPNGFYYEPSYAGCALAFAFPMLFLLALKRGSPKAYLAPALLLGAVLFVSSRGGILCAFLALMGMVLSAFLGKRRDLIRPLAWTALWAFLLVGTALLSPSIRKYMDFLAGPLGPSGIASRIVDPQQSEGVRVANILNSLQLWSQHPILGEGVSTSVDKNGKGLAFVSESMWLEVGVESGLLGFFAFGFALLKTLWDAVQGRWRFALPILCAVAAHMVVDMNFTSTFPRLDYWLLFFGYISLCRNTADEKTP